MADFLKHISVIGALVVVSILYERFKAGDPWGEHSRHYEMVKHHLLTDRHNSRRHLPIIWIHLNTELNARNWESFYSRTSNNVNQPYMFLTIKSIINRCNKDLNICLINDDSFKKLMPSCNIELNEIPSPSKELYRKALLARLMHTYGGILVPPSYLCFHNIKDMYDEGTSDAGMFAAEVFQDDELVSQPSKQPLLASSEFMGCRVNDGVMKLYADFLEKLAKTNYTAEPQFNRTIGKWLLDYSKKQKIKLIRGELIGTRKSCGTIITIEDLLGDTYVDIDDRCIGIYIPEKEILSRTAYQWFARLSTKQVVESNTYIGKQILLAQS